MVSRTLSAIRGQIFKSVPAYEDSARPWLSIGIQLKILILSEQE